MRHEIGCGRSTIGIDLPPETQVSICSARLGEPLDDPAAAVAAALDSPLEFPPLGQAIVPGDRIVLALDKGVPQADAVLAGIVHVLVHHGAEPSDIKIVCAESREEANGQSPASLLAPELRDRIEIQHHDPSDKDALAYLAASRDGKPIYFNRTICDADVVLPIGSLKLEPSLGYIGVWGCLFPSFSDDDTQKRFRAPSSADWPAHQRRRREEAEEAAWLLGVQFTLQAAPGRGDTILHVLAGEGRAVERAGRRLCEAAWLHEVPRRADLVVAGIEGGRGQQTWENFARALYAASQVVASGGAIVLCTDLDCSPGPALARLTSPGADDDETGRQIRRDRAHDALSAALLLETRQRAHIYLLSHLSADVVESLGLGYVTTPEEIGRLGGRSQSCILLSGAQHAIAVAREA